MLHSIICPVLLLIDFVFFDLKGSIRWFDPIWWCVPVLCYGVFLYLCPVKIYKSGVSWLDFVFYGVLALAVGYILLIIDKIKERIR